MISGFVSPSEIKKIQNTVQARKKFQTVPLFYSSVEMKEMTKKKNKVLIGPDW